MKTLQALTPIALGLLTLTVASSVNAQAIIDTVDNGNLSVTGMTRGSGCTALFSPRGELLQNGRSCSSREIGKAQAAIDTYLREQGAPERNSSNSMRQRLTLICYGEGRKPGIESRNSYEWNSSRHRYELQNRIESSTDEFDSEVQVEIRNMQGKIHLAGKLIPPINSGGTDGWWNLKDLRVTPEQITGKYQVNGLNHPRVEIDRRSGRIAINGIENFRGTCDSGDWSNSRTRF
ncbi:hypothetical protein CDG77_18510 [Nostoc sp. 'Peltigera membranacea cyanobiont' 213]|uniref:hypothetical protein n=1 Tax=unclassified Nostoc TaxID=2593658 RepID=UPI000B95BD28|nr:MULTISPECIES: hypothetical protein [unclassified Nostoc]AVH63240.1 hypothetical protein NPM_1414 [Nostoc sp. 'Peltigera membranacea cyanobiont' N6]OYD89625.1 hypothetical protein CDG77_18510 [Nostoc sp. 'Peltigera membranacea cyanobiont' 213]